MPANNGKGLVGRAVQVEGEGGRVYRGGEASARSSRGERMMNG